MKDVFQTSFLEKRDGRWVHVLMHGAYPIDKIPGDYVRRFYSDLFEKKEKKQLVLRVEDYHEFQI